MEGGETRQDGRSGGGVRGAGRRPGLHSQEPRLTEGLGPHGMVRVE